MKDALQEDLLPRVKSPSWLTIPLGLVGVLLGLGLLALFPFYVYSLIVGETEWSGDAGAMLCLALGGGLMFLLPSAAAFRQGLRPAAKHPFLLLLRDDPEKLTTYRRIDFRKRGQVVGVHLHVRDTMAREHLLFCEGEADREDLIQRLTAALPHLRPAERPAR